MKKKEPFIFKTERPRVDYSRYVYWCNPYEPINKGNLEVRKVGEKRKISSLLLRNFENQIKVTLTNKANFVMGSCI